MFVGGRTWQAKKINDRSTFVWPANNNNNNNKDYISIFIFSVLSPGLLFLNYGLIRLLNYYTCTINKPYWYNPGGGGGGGKRRGLGPRNDVLTTCKAITLRDGQRIIAAFFHGKYF